MLKVIEILEDSDVSWEDAAKQAVARAHRTLRHVKSINIKNFAATVGEDGRITSYRINANISFALEDGPAEAMSSSSAAASAPSGGRRGGGGGGKGKRK
jgi:flavin-binding protein dodecin